ncbi:MAG: substrate-binding domain-containing protein [Chloroflexota bacterium]
MKRSGVIFLLLLIILFSASSHILSAQDDPMISPEAQAVIRSLPEDLQNLYVKVGSSVGVGAYDNFTMPEPPWKFCFSDSYQGNPWRVAVRIEFERLVKVYQDAKLVSEYEFQNANNDVDLQDAQIQQFISDHCNIIFSIPGSTDGHDAVIQTAYDAGIPFITGEGAVTSPLAITVTSNFYTWGFDMATGIAKALNGKGNVLLVEGLKGHNIVILQRQGADAAFAQYPDIKILGSVNGDWTPTITKSVLRDVLGLIHEPVDAVWTTGSEAETVAAVFEERGLSLPLITASISGDALGYWKEHPDDFKFYGHGNLPSRLADGMFKVGVRTLLGQTPKLNVIMVPLPEVTQDTLGKWYQPCMNTEAVSVFPIPPTDPNPDSVLDAYFKNAEAIPDYNYAETPNPCSNS